MSGARQVRKKGGREMPDETTISEDKFALLTQKIEREARFTRVLVVTCMCAAVAVTFWCFNYQNSFIPTLVVNEYEAKLGTIYGMWKANEATWKKQPEAAAPAAAPTK
jgi:hypothetical protein